MANRIRVWPLVGCLAMTSGLATGPLGATSKEWVAVSDANTELVTQFFARYLPEIIASLGVHGFDEEVLSISASRDAAAKEEETALLAELERRLAGERDAAVRQDLAILVDLLQRDLRQTELEHELLLPYFDVAEIVFRGLRGLLDEQVDEDRRAAAVVRLRRYAGLEEGYTPLTDQAEAYTRARFGEPQLLGPYTDEVEKDLARAPRLIEGIGQMLEGYGLSDDRAAYEALQLQLASYREFVEEEILPRARSDFRLPAELYALRLEDLGVDMSVAELTSRAKVAFKEIQNEMQALAEVLAVDLGLDDNDYRSVLRVLKQRQLSEERIVEFYTARIDDIEAIIEREAVTSLPQRPLRLRLASAAEEAMVQAATIRWPQLLGEAAEVGEIILPVRRVSTDESADVLIDDFTNEAAAWSLIVHEGRPGHELQMASILEQGVSKARAFYAFNSTNIEGWALYAESEMKPYLPLDAQLVSLQYRLLRAARAFLDPGLQAGEVTPAQAMQVLTENVAVSVPLAEQEVERYTSRNPGQATAYFCGYARLLELRTDAELELGDAFDRREFNDFILAQGLLPPALLRQAVIEKWVPSRQEP